MAEQSIGFPSGSGDGVAGGYPADRMRLMETNTIGTGVQVVGNNLALTGTGTANLTVGIGAALVSGYEYENTSSLNISVTGLANNTYNVVLIVNASAGPLAVSKSASGTTTPGYSVRAALYLGTPAVPYLLLGTVQVASSAIAAGGITPSYAAYAESRQLPYQSYAWMTGGSATLTNVNLQYDVTGYTSSSVTADYVFSVNTTTGEITVRRTGLYAISYSATYSSGTTGQRNARLVVDGTQTQNATITPVAANAFMGVTWLHPLNAGQVIKISTNTITTAGQSVASAYLTIARV